MTVEARVEERNAPPQPDEAALVRIARPYGWMWPARLLGRLRAGLLGATLADAYRLRQLPSVVGKIVVPGIAVLLPLGLAVLHATTPTGEQAIPDPLAIVIRDVFTESIPFLVAALIMGIATPAAGALLVVVYAIGNLAVTIASGELDPPAGALAGRLVSYLLLWMLVVEIPLAGRRMAEWTIASEPGAAARRLMGAALGGAVVAAMTFIWVQAAPVLITVVYFTTAAWGSPFLVAVAPLQENGSVLAATGAAAGLVLLWVRYAGAIAVLSPELPRGGSILPGHLRRAGSLVLGFALLWAVVHQPVDAFVLLAALVAARPIGRLALSATGLAGPLARVPGPVRLIAGFGVAVAVNLVFFSRFWESDVSRFFHMVIGIAIGFVVIAFFTSAEEAAGRPARRQPLASTGATTSVGLLVLGLFAVALPSPVLADNCGDVSDCFSNVAQAAFAAAAAAAMAAMASAGAALKDAEQSANDFLERFQRDSGADDDRRRWGERGPWMQSTSAADTQPSRRQE